MLSLTRILDTKSALHRKKTSFVKSRKSIKGTFCPSPCADPEGGAGVRTPPPLKNPQNIGFISNTGPDPLKNHKAAKPAFNVGPSSARQ